ncbi:MAG: dockerin type I domain-containing protein [Pseudomonadota bacterium]
MRGDKRRLLAIFVMVLCGLLLFSGVAGALEIVLEPAKAQREVNGKVRVHIYANPADRLISMGVKVSFNPAILQAASASKCEDVNNGWLMDADGNPATTNDQYNTPAVSIDNTNGCVTMIGGHLIGTSTVGLSGKVLLGWIVFEAKALGNSALAVDLGKYHPDHPNAKFDNFVKLGGAVDEPTNVPGSLGVICVVQKACVGEANGNNIVDMGDFAMLRAAMGKVFPAPGYNVLLDLNANGAIDMGDFTILRAHMGVGCAQCDIPQ